MLVGSILGFAIGFLLPTESQHSILAMQWLESLALGIGRYAVVPVLVFSLTMAVYELRQSGGFWRFVLKNSLLIVLSSGFVIAAGILVSVLFAPQRIPIGLTGQFEALNIETAGSVEALFPANMFAALAGDGIYLLPLCVFAFFLGMGLNYDRNFAKPVVALIDSLSRIFYYIASFFTEILGFILIVLAAFWAIRYQSVLQSGVFRDLIIVLGAFALVFCFGFLPLLLYLLRPKENPWRILYGLFGPAIAGFVSGDVNFSFIVLTRHLKENLGVRRRACAVSLSLCAVFCRGGSAMVAAVGFIVIISSFAYLHIAPMTLVYIGLQALLVSFMLVRHPGNGAFIAIAALCLMYGGGEFRAGYLILQPLAFYLIAIGTFIDVMLSAFISYVAAHTSSYVAVAEEKKTINNFI
ncbi:MAG: dicarboxylate/amino acid:cation symporter [Spirochaetes bacterium]|nr:dicarboxylate/amino acid:cation symporter [Spirochaetota bacterium]